MRYLVTSAEMKQYDKATIERIGIPGTVLMERAALQTFLFLREKGLTATGKDALILAGYGNNGGDGLALARLLCEAGVNVAIWLVGMEEKATKDFLLQKSILNFYPVQFVSGPEKTRYDLVMDALFGVGLSRKLSGEFEEAVRTANELEGIKVAMDVPSGVSADTGEIMGIAFKADATVTYGFEKKGLYLWPGRGEAGEIRLVDVGITSRAFFDHEPECFALEEGMEELLPQRRPEGNKGTFGKALIVAGSFQMAGAAVLCARACYRAGAGMVKVLTAPENRVILQESLPEALLGDVTSQENVAEGLKWCDVICIGPGLGKSEKNLAALRACLGLNDAFGEGFQGEIKAKPLILDADGINLICENESLLAEVKKQGDAGRCIIMTPHAGEFLRIWNAARKLTVMSGDDLITEGDVLDLKAFKGKPWEYAKKLAETLSAIIVAKDARTFICAPEHKTCMNLSGNDGMATAGSGDVLAGLITAFLCQTRKTGTDPFDEACKAVRFHGLLGDAAAGKLGEHAVMAGDLEKCLP